MRFKAFLGLLSAAPFRLPGAGEAQQTVKIGAIFPSAQRGQRRRARKRVEARRHRQQRSSRARQFPLAKNAGLPPRGAKVKWCSPIIKGTPPPARTRRLRLITEKRCGADGAYQSGITLT